jgi:hypothetical protein
MPTDATLETVPADILAELDTCVQETESWPSLPALPVTSVQQPVPSQRISAPQPVSAKNRGPRRRR